MRTADCKNIYFIVQNIRSLRKNFDRFVLEIQSLPTSPILLILTEIWAYSEEMNQFFIPGFVTLSNCNSTYRCGGVAVFIRSDLHPQLMNSRSISLCSMDALCLDFTVNDVIFTILCIYRFGNKSIDAFIDDLTVLLTDTNRTNLLFVGDINLDILVNTRSSDNYLSLMAEFGLECIVNEPTRIVGNSSTCIDHIFFRHNSRILIDGTSVDHLGISDHALLSSCIVLRSHSTDNRTSLPVLRSSIDLEALNILLLNENWDEVYDCHNSNDAFSLFINGLLRHIKACSSSSVISGKKRRLKPWMNSRILCMVRFKRKLANKFKRNPSTLNGKMLKNYSNKLNRQISSAKKCFYRSNFRFCEGNTKKTWSIVNSILGRNLAPKVDRILIDGCSATSNKTIADHFNTHFLNSTASSGINSTVIVNQSSFGFIPFDPMDILAIVRGLENKASKDIFGLDCRIVKGIIFNIIDILCYLFNKCFFDGVFPEALKTSIVVPIFKSGDRSVVSNYRPISLSPVFSKVYEKLVKKQFTDFVDRYNLVSRSQFGFSSGRSTEDAVIAMVDEVTSGLEKRLQTASVFVDLTKAFDSVQFHCLFDTLYSLGFRGFCLDWIKSFFTGRRQCTVVNGIFSDLGHIGCGVPQGSVLGPLFFNLYINFVFSLGLNSRLIGYADDLTLICSAADAAHLQAMLQDDLNVLCRHLNEVGLVVSPKTKFVVYGSASSLNVFPLVVSSGLLSWPIDCVREYKYLGVVVDSALSWKAHITRLKGSLRAVCRNMYVLRRYCPFDTLLSVYNGLVNSLLCYCICTWGSASSYLINGITAMQKRILRVINHMPARSPSRPLFVESGLLNCRQSFVFRCLRLLLRRFLVTGALDSRKFLRVPVHRTERRKKTFGIISRVLFNNLPHRLRSEISLSKWKDWIMYNTNVESVLIPRYAVS